MGTATLIKSSKTSTKPQQKTKTTTTKAQTTTSNDKLSPEAEKFKEEHGGLTPYEYYETTSKGRSEKTHRVERARQFLESEEGKAAVQANIEGEYEKVSIQYEKAHPLQTIETPAFQAQRTQLLQQSAISDLMQYGLLTTKREVAGYTENGKPIYGKEYVAISEKGERLGREKIIELEERATWGGALDLYFGEQGQVYMYPEGTRETLKEKGIETPLIIEKAGQSYLIAQKEGTETIELAEINPYTNVLKPAEAKSTEDIFEPQPGTTISYRLVKDETGEEKLEIMTTEAQTSTQSIPSQTSYLNIPEPEIYKYMKLPPIVEQETNIYGVTTLTTFSDFGMTYITADGGIPKIETIPLTMSYQPEIIFKETPGIMTVGKVTTIYKTTTGQGVLITPSGQPVQYTALGAFILHDYSADIADQAKSVEDSLGLKFGEIRPFSSAIYLTSGFAEGLVKGVVADVDVVIRTAQVKALGSKITPTQFDVLSSEIEAIKPAVYEFPVLVGGIIVGEVVVAPLASKALGGIGTKNILVDQAGKPIKGISEETAKRLSKTAAKYEPKTSIFRFGKGGIVEEVSASGLPRQIFKAPVEIEAKALQYGGKTIELESKYLIDTVKIPVPSVKFNVVNPIKYMAVATRATLDTVLKSKIPERTITKSAIREIKVIEGISKTSEIAETTSGIMVRTIQKPTKESLIKLPGKIIEDIKYGIKYEATPSTIAYNIKQTITPTLQYAEAYAEYYSKPLIHSGEKILETTTTVSRPGREAIRWATVTGSLQTGVEFGTAAVPTLIEEGDIIAATSSGIERLKTTEAQSNIAGAAVGGAFLGGVEETAELLAPTVKKGITATKELKGKLISATTEVIEAPLEYAFKQGGIGERIAQKIGKTIPDIPKTRIDLPEIAMQVSVPITEKVYTSTPRYIGGIRTTTETLEASIELQNLGKKAYWAKEEGQPLLQREGQITSTPRYIGGIRTTTETLEASIELQNLGKKAYWAKEEGQPLLQREGQMAKTISRPITVSANINIPQQITEQQILKQRQLATKELIVQAPQQTFLTKQTERLTTKEAERLAARQTERMAIRQSARQATRDTERMVIRETERMAERLAERYTERLAERQTARQSARQATREITRQTTKLILIQIPKLSLENKPVTKIQKTKRQKLKLGYSPSVLGILTGKKEEKIKKVYTGGEIRGIPTIKRRGGIL